MCYRWAYSPLESESKVVRAQDKRIWGVGALRLAAAEGRLVLVAQQHGQGFEGPRRLVERKPC
jgi:hypothetical protein